MIISTPEGRQFSHNIFREYFAAKLFENANAKDIIERISIPGSNRLDPTWFNILGFILQQNPSQELINWLMDVEPLALARLEPDRFDCAVRYSVLECVLNRIDKENIWFRDEICSEQQLAVFTQSEHSLDLLLNHICSPVHFRSLYFCLSVLRFFTDLYDKGELVLQTLTNCYQNGTTRAHEKRVAISAIAKLNLDNNKTTQDLLDRFSENASAYERLGVYEYLLSSGIVNQHVDYALFMSSLQNYSHNYTSLAFNFFELTKTFTESFQRFLAEKEIHNHMFTVIDFIITWPDLTDLLCKKYMDDDIKDPSLLKDVALHCNGSDDVFEKCSAAILEKTGEVLVPPAPIFDYNKYMKNDLQTFFDYLFDYESMRQLLEQLTLKCGNPEITCRQLIKKRIKWNEYPAGTQMLRQAIIQSNLPDIKVSDFLDNVNWDAFFLNRLCTIVENDKDSIHITPGQMEEIQRVCKQLETTLDFHIAIKEKSNHQFTVTYAVLQYISIVESLQLPAPDSYYLGLIEIPTIFIESIRSASDKYDLIEQHISHEMISNKVSELTPLETRVSVLDELLFGCKRYQIGTCKDVALKFCQNKGLTGYDRRNALEYIKAVFGSDCLINEVMSEADDALFEEMASMLLSEKSVSLEAEMLQRFKEKPTKFLLKSLISLGNETALDYYLKTSAAAGTIMELDEDGEITRAIASIDKTELIPLLINGVQLRFSGGFIDKSFHTLYSSLYSSLSLCAKKDYAAVWQNLERIKTALSDNLELVCFCNTLQHEIEASYNLGSTKIWTPTEVRLLLKSID